MQVLFVGGPKHGQLVDVSNPLPGYYNVLLKKDLRLSLSYPTEDIALPTYDIVTYCLEYFVDHNYHPDWRAPRLPAYVHGNITHTTADDVIAMYRGHRERERLEQIRQHTRLWAMPGIKGC